MLINKKEVKMKKVDIIFYEEKIRILENKLKIVSKLFRLLMEKFDEIFKIFMKTNKSVNYD